MFVLDAKILPQNRRRQRLTRWFPFVDCCFGTVSRLCSLPQNQTELLFTLRVDHRASQPPFVPVSYPLSRPSPQLPSEPSIKSGCLSVIHLRTSEPDLHSDPSRFRCRTLFLLLFWDDGAGGCLWQHEPDSSTCRQEPGRFPALGSNRSRCVTVEDFLRLPLFVSLSPLRLV